MNWLGIRLMALLWWVWWGRRLTFPFFMLKKKILHKAKQHNEKIRKNRDHVFIELKKTSFYLFKQFLPPHSGCENWKMLPVMKNAFKSFCIMKKTNTKNSTYIHSKCKQITQLWHPFARRGKKKNMKIQ